MSSKSQAYLTLNRAAAGLQRRVIHNAVEGTQTGGAALQRFGVDEVKDIVRTARPGDLLLIGTRSTFEHACVYVGNGEIVHAVFDPKGKSPGVLRESIAEVFEAHNVTRAEVLHERGTQRADLKPVVDFALAQVGKPYNYLLRTKTTDAFYCVQLAWASAERSKRPPSVELERAFHGLLKVVKNDDLRRSPDFESVWSKNAPPVSAKAR